LQSGRSNSNEKRVVWISEAKVGFMLEHFAALYSEKFVLSSDNLASKLWFGYYDSTKKKLHKFLPLRERMLQFIISDL
jgi:hypothetical protein